ncbi:tetratricopeptide repeat protein [Thermoleptolyngbya sp.]
MSQSSHRQNLTFNQQSYLRLKLALSLNLRRQVFIAVCDDLPLRDRLASQLQSDFSNPSPIHQGDRASWEAGERCYPRLVTLDLNLSDPNPIVQVAQWLADSPPPMNGSKRRSPVPAFQFLGIEQLTRQSPTTQRMFITHLQGIERSLPVLDSSLLFWMPQPWFRLLPQSALEFWRCRTGVFEFVGEPTPRPPKTMAPIVSTAPAAQRASSPPPSAAASPPLARKGTQATPQNSTPAAQTPARAEAAQNVEKQAAKAPESRRPADLGTNPPANPWAIAPSAPSAAAAATPPAAPAGTVRPAPPAKPPASSPVRPGAIAQSPAPPPASATPSAPTAPPAAAKPSSSPVAGSFRLDAAPTPAPSSVSVGRATAASAAAGKPLTPAASSSASLLPPSPPKPPLADLSPPAESEAQITQLLEQIAHLHQQSASADQLQDAYRMLGDAYRDRIEQGDTSLPTLMAALQAYEQVMMRLPDQSPLWPDLLNDVGNLCWLLSRNPPAPDQVLPNLRQAIQSYQLALKKLDTHTQAQSYPMLHNNLGAAYADLARYEQPVENLQKSAQSYREALRYRDAKTDPARYASTQNNLGTTYWNLAQHHQPKESLKRAIAAYQEALKYPNSQPPLSYAMIQNNLGTALWSLAQIEQPAVYLPKAIAAYRQSLQQRTLDAAPAAYAATQNNLGTALWHLALCLGDRPQEQLQKLQAAIQAYEAALQGVAKVETLPSPPMLSFDPATTHNNLGLAYFHIATQVPRLLGTAPESAPLEKALHHHIQAATRWQHQPELRQAAMQSVLQTLKAFYELFGTAGQNQALSIVPAHLLPELLPRL